MKCLLWISTLLALVAYICGPVGDPDLWWHIVVGDWILAHGRLPVQDHWNLFGRGEAWMAYSWSNEIVYALVDRLAGVEGLYFAKLFLSVALALSLGFVYSKVSKSWFLGLCLALFAFASTHGHLTLRPQTFTWILFIWLLYLAHLFSKNGLNWRVALFTFLTFCLWANTHITTALGLIALAFFIAFERQSLREKLLLLLIAVLGTFLTPYFGAEWIVFFTKSSHPLAFSSIAEFKPANILQFSTGFLVLSTAFLVSLYVQERRAFSTMHLALTLCFVGASLAVIKFLPLAVLLICFLIALAWGKCREAGRDFGNLEEGVCRLEKLIDRFPREGLCFVLLVLAFLYARHTAQTPLAESHVPSHAMDFFIEQKLPHPLLNDFGRGGYIMYRLSDDEGNLKYPVPIDGRTNVTPEEVFEKFQRSFFGHFGWQEFIDLVDPKTILWPLESPLSPLLLSTGNWCVVYASGSVDYGFGLFVNRDYGMQRELCIPFPPGEGESS